jgi:molybdopterin biosynthesis enzyme
LKDLESGTLTDSAYTSKKEMRLFPVKVNNGLVEPLQFWGSMMLRGLAASSHFAIIEAGKGASGEAVELIRLPWKS